MSNGFATIRFCGLQQEAGGLTASPLTAWNIASIKQGLFVVRADAELNGQEVLMVRRGEELVWESALRLPPGQGLLLPEQDRTTHMYITSKALQGDRLPGSGEYQLLLMRGDTLLSAGTLELLDGTEKPRESDVVPTVEVLEETAVASEATEGPEEVVEVLSLKQTMFQVAERMSELSTFQLEQTVSAHVSNDRLTRRQALEQACADGTVVVDVTLHECAILFAFEEDGKRVWLRTEELALGAFLQADDSELHLAAGHATIPDAWKSAMVRILMPLNGRSVQFRGLAALPAVAQELSAMLSESRLSM